MLKCPTLCRRAGSPALRQAGRLPLRRFGRPCIENFGDVGMIHHRQGLPLRLEARHHLPGVPCQLDDLGDEFLPYRSDSRFSSVQKWLAMARANPSECNRHLTSNRRRQCLRPTLDGWIEQPMRINTSPSVLPMNRKVGKASRLPPSERPAELNPSRWMSGPARHFGSMTLLGSEPTQGTRISEVTQNTVDDQKRLGFPKLPVVGNADVFCVARQPEVRVPGDELNRRRADERFVGGFRRRDFHSYGQEFVVHWPDDKKRVTVSIGSVAPSQSWKSSIQWSNDRSLRIVAFPGGSAP